MTRKKRQFREGRLSSYGGSNINIYSKNKGLRLGGGVLTIGVCVGGGGGEREEVTKIFVINLGGGESRFFF